MQLKTLATANIGLVASDVFYFGNAVDESGDTPADAAVNATDEIGARNDPHSPFMPVPIDDVYDLNRDKVVIRTHAPKPDGHWIIATLVSGNGVITSLGARYYAPPHVVSTA